MWGRLNGKSLGLGWSSRSHCRNPRTPSVVAFAMFSPRVDNPLRNSFAEKPVITLGQIRAARTQQLRSAEIPGGAGKAPSQETATDETNHQHNDDPVDEDIRTLLCSVLLGAQLNGLQPNET